MKVFISWSGDRSKKVAELLEWWLKCVIQAVYPWISSKSIDRGTIWFAEINDQLASTVTGIVCLTKENRDKPWILFESGALAKGLSSSRVCTFLIDLEPKDLENPLAQFNHTFPTKEGLYSLVSTINRSLKDAQLPEAVLERCFETYWPQFEKEFRTILSTTHEAHIEARKEPDILNEVLTTVRDLDKRMRTIESPMAAKSSSPGDLNDELKRKYLVRPDPKIMEFLKLLESSNISVPVSEDVRYIIEANKSTHSS